MNLLNRLAIPVLAIPRPAKRLLVLIVDSCLCVLTVWLAFYLRLDTWVRLYGDPFFEPRWAVLTSLVFALPLFITHGFYRVIFRYSDLSAIGMVLRAFGIYTMMYTVVVTAVGLPGVPRSVGLIQPMLLFIAVGASRAFARLWLGGLYQARWQRIGLPKVLIYGAGATGRQLALVLNNSTEMRVAGYLDDDDRLHGHVLNGLPIYDPGSLEDLSSSQKISAILLALPSISRKRRNEIISKIRNAHVAVRTLPSMTDLAKGKISLSDIHELDIDDLLGREAVPPNHILLSKNVAGKVVMVTGAGGSIGSELCRQVIALNPEKLLLVEQSEFALYAVHRELSNGVNGGSACNILPLLASVQNEDRMHDLVSTWKPHTIYHAAAYKHVPLVEHNPAEGVRNNVIGTLNVARIAAEHNVADFVLVSTDKAVRPTNIMGASKRLAEMVLQALAKEPSATRFTIVRFGNVLGSSGSVVPLFRQQIRDGGPLTVTHPEVTRYFMTIPEAAQLVIQAGAMGKGGEVFVLDMGQPVKIMTLARRIIELSGLTLKDEDNPDGDIEISVVGLRPGEKLYEELLIGDSPQSTSHSRIMKANEEFVSWVDLHPKLDALCLALNVNDVPVIRRMLQSLVSGYQPAGDIVDLVQLEHEAKENCT